MHFAKYSHSDRARVESISHSLELPEKCAIGKVSSALAKGRTRLIFTLSAPDL